MPSSASSAKAALVGQHVDGDERHAVLGQELLHPEAAGAARLPVGLDGGLGGRLAAWRSSKVMVGNSFAAAASIASAGDGAQGQSRITDRQKCRSSSQRPGATSIFDARRLPARSLHPHRRSRGVGVESRPPLGVRQAAGGAQPGSGSGTARHRAAAAIPVFSKPIMNFRGLGAGSRILTSAEDYDAPSHRRALLDDAARGRARLERRGAGGRRAEVVAACDGARHRRGHVRPLDHPRRRRSAARGRLRGLDRAEPRRASPAFSTWRPSAAPSSRRTCGCPISGPISTGRAGPRPSSASIATASGATTTATAATGSASCCAGRGVGAIAIRQRSWWRRWRPCPGYRACRSRFTSTRPPERHSMPPGGFRVAIVNAFDLTQGRGGARGAARAFPGRRARRQRQGRRGSAILPR